MDVVAGQWGGLPAVDEVARTVEWLPPWTRLRVQGRGAATVDEAAGTAKLSLPWMWSRDGWEGLLLWTRPHESKGVAAVVTATGTRGRGCRHE